MWVDVSDFSPTSTSNKDASNLPQGVGIRYTAYTLHPMMKWSSAKNLSEKMEP